MLVAVPHAGRDGRGALDERPRPKEPEVLITTASSGEGVPALLAALDRHRATSADGPSTPARLARAEAQVWAILGDRLRGQLHYEGRSALTSEVMTAVAEHRLDPYSAADRLLRDIVATRG
jgi:LAO/AO transport system kinase